MSTRYILKAHAEAYQPTKEELEARTAGHAEWQHKLELKSAVSEAEEAFRAKDYALVIHLLTPFEGELEKIPSAKLTLAHKRQ